MTRSFSDRLRFGGSWAPSRRLRVFSLEPGMGFPATSQLWPQHWPATVSPGVSSSDGDAFDQLRPATTPGVVSAPMRFAKPRVRSFEFPEPTEKQVGLVDAADNANPQTTGARGDLPLTTDLSRTNHAQRSGSTRIKPPSDLIKFEDRLFYVLQPSLESILKSSAIRFPFHPFPYQLEGVAFLYPRHEAVLADEMGLGKTMQAITSVRLLVHSGRLRRMLLICPKPLVTNWRREFSLWAPELPISVIEGDQTRRSWQWRRTETVITIANYELLLRDEEEINQEGQEFDLVVLDESQRIKNRNSATSRAVRSIARSRSWALTGTPVENSAEDLVGIFEFVSPGMLRSDMKPRRMGRTVSDHVLRRTKDQVLSDLPPILNRDADIELSPEQRATYQTAEDEGVVCLSQMGDSLTIQHVFELILRLKQICNFDPSTGVSSKIERLEADLTECVQSGRKAIVFSQWVQTIDELSKRLTRFGPLEYHGRVPSRRRDAVIERFRSDPDSHVLLMSYGAGSVGLNLQFASYVFLFDRWWNPAVEDQAINRAHRIGTAEPVTVTRFTSLDTIEERIQRILDEKRDLFDTIFSDTRPAKNLGLTQHEIFALFDLQTPQGPIAPGA